jgi:hypothetical protein
VMHGERGQGVRRTHGNPCYDEQRCHRSSGAPGATPDYWDRFLVQIDQLSKDVTMKKIISALFVTLVAGSAFAQAPATTAVKADAKQAATVTKATAVEAKDVTKATAKSAGKIVSAEANDATGGAPAEPKVAAAHKTSAKSKAKAHAKAKATKKSAAVEADMTKEAAAK